MKQRKLFSPTAEPAVGSGHMCSSSARRRPKSHGAYCLHLRVYRSYGQTTSEPSTLPTSAPLAPLASPLKQLSSIPATTLYVLCNPLCLHDSGRLQLGLLSLHPTSNFFRIFRCGIFGVWYLNH